MTDSINDADIQLLVQSFYTKVRQDTLLAPIFATKIKDSEWDSHIAHIASFWRSIFLKTGEFTGNPLHKHMEVQGLTPAHFSHWLALFQDTALDVLPSDKAQTIHAMAERIAQSLQMGLAFNYEKNGAADHPFTAFGIRVRG